MAHNVSQTSFLYFGDKGPQSPWLCHFSTNHLDRTDESSKVTFIFIALYTIEIVSKQCYSIKHESNRTNDANPKFCYKAALGR